MTITKEEILKLLEDVYDPEIPVLNIVEMGIVRGVKEVDSGYEIEVTPTYSGCPAMKTIEDEILDVLNLEGIGKVNVRKVFSPPWTTDWLNDETKLKLRNYGIAPPEGKTEEYFLINKITCPFCKSNNTKLTSEFGSTSCKSLHFCNDCCQPFEHFKCI